jgi:hypothetical protein
MTHEEQKALLDAIACALHGWPADARKTYLPLELPALAARLRRKAEILAAARNEALEVVAVKVDGRTLPNED